MSEYIVILRIEDEKRLKIEAENKGEAIIEAKRQSGAHEHNIVGIEIDELFNY